MFLHFGSSRSTPTQLPPGPPPWITLLLEVACIVIFLGITAGNSNQLPTLTRWGFRSASQVWGGAYWGLLSNVFVHREAWHITFNAYWLWVLGRRLERTIGSLRFLYFFIAAAFVSSAYELATGDTGIGFSGVGYAIFGFMWIARPKVLLFRQVLTHQIILLWIIWLFACVLVTHLKIMTIGNAAHISGLIFGVAVAGCFVRGWKPRLMRTGLSALAILSLIPLFWCPWSLNWLMIKAFDAVNARRYQDSLVLCNRIVQKDPMNAWAYSTRGYCYFYLGDFSKSIVDLTKARQLDPNTLKN